PLQARKDAIDLATQSIKTQQDIDTIAFEMAKANMQSKLIDEELWHNAQQTTLELQNRQFASLVTGFEQAMIKSGAFTEAEAQEFLKRMGYWNSETEKLSELYSSIDSVRTLAEDTKSALDQIPRDITVTVHQVTEGSSGHGIPGYASGGIAWTPQIASIAEEEPEAIIPLSKLPVYVPAMRGQDGGSSASQPAGDTFIFKVDARESAITERELFRQAQRARLLRSMGGA
ncbi:MAG: hypothetical protein ACYC6C_14155, partial [Coriobacteriia bacterium]